VDIVAASGNGGGAARWYGELRKAGRRCASLDFANMSATLPAYAAAVAWDNVRVCNRLSTADQQVFAELLGRSFTGINDGTWPASHPVPAIHEVMMRGTLSNLRLYQEYAEHVLAHGIRASDAGLDIASSEFSTLCSIQEWRRLPHDNHLQTRDPLTDILSPPGDPSDDVVWLAPFSCLRDALDASDKATEAMARVGIESKSGGQRHVLIVETAAVADELRVPTVADSTLYCLWGATDSGPHGMTRHTIRGRGHGVPEFVIRRRHLREAVEAARPSGTPSPVRLHSGVWETEDLWISPDHAERRWRDEIEPAIG